MILINEDSEKKTNLFTEFSELPKPCPNGWDDTKVQPDEKLFILSEALSSFPLRVPFITDSILGTKKKARVNIRIEMMPNMIICLVNFERCLLYKINK